MTTLAAPPTPARVADPEPVRQVVTCPHCGDPVAGLLSGCDKPECRSLEIAEDQLHVRLDDQ